MSCARTQALTAHSMAEMLVVVSQAHQQQVGVSFARQKPAFALVVVACAGFILCGRRVAGRREQKLVRHAARAAFRRRDPRRALSPQAAAATDVPRHLHTK